MALEGWSTLRHRDFALACSVRLAVTLALHIVNVAIGWYIYDVTSNAYALAYLGLAGFIPSLLLPIVSGYASDRFDRRLVLFASDLLLTVLAGFLLWLVSSRYGLVWPIYIVVVVMAMSRAFHAPATQAIIPALVPPEQLQSAITFSSGAQNMAQIAGPALGGILYAINPRLAFIVAALMFAGAAAAALAIRHRSAPRPGQMPFTYKQLIAGFEFALTKRVVFGAVALDAAVVLAGGVTLLLPIFAKDILMVGPEGLGALRAGPAIGAVLMAIWLANNDYVHRDAGPKLFFTVAMFGLAIVAFGLSQSFLLSMACLIALGAADMVSVVIRHTMVQAETPEALRGRVSGVNTMFISCSSELSQLRAGLVAGLLGAAPAAVIGGFSVIGLAWLWPRLFPDLKARDHLVEPEEKSRL